MASRAPCQLDKPGPSISSGSLERLDELPDKHELLYIDEDDLEESIARRLSCQPDRRMRRSRSFERLYEPSDKYELEPTVHVEYDLEEFHLLPLRQRSRQKKVFKKKNVGHGPGFRSNKIKARSFKDRYIEDSQFIRLESLVLDGIPTLELFLPFTSKLTHISVGDKVSISAEFWNTAVHIVNDVREGKHIWHTIPENSNINGVVKWLGPLQPSVNEPQLFARIQTDIPISTEQYFYCAAHNEVFLPVEFVARHCSGKNIVEIPTPSYPMNATPHGIALIVEQDVLNSKCIMEAFQYLKYDVRICLPSQMTQQTKEIVNTDHTIYDSFICYISSCKSDEINELMSKVQQCSSLQGKPKLFFIQSDSEPFQNIGADMFVAWINYPQNTIAGHSFATAISTLFKGSVNSFELHLIMEYLAAIVGMFPLSGQYSKSRSLLTKKTFFLSKSNCLGFSLLLEEGYITTRWTKLTILGPPGSGKTSLLQLLQEDPSFILYGGEIVKKMSFIAEKGNSSQPWRKANLRTMIVQAMNKETKGSINFSQLDVMHDEENIPFFKLSSLLFTAPFSEAEDILPAAEAHWIYVIDSGGQSTFLDFAPALQRYNSVNILTHKLNENLDDKPTFYYDVEGKPFSEPEEKRLTNLQLLEASFRSLASINPPDLQSIDVKWRHKEPYCLLVLGTFIDKIKESRETLEQKNEKLNLALRQFRDVRIDYRQTRQRIIFPVNTRARGKEEIDIAKLLRKKVCKYYIEANIPIRWFLLQLQLDQYQKAKGTPIISKSDCFKIGEVLKMNAQDLEAALMYYHDLTIYLYFPDVLPHVVFLHPQPLFDKLSELISISVEAVVDYLEDEGVDLPFGAHSQLKDKGTFKRELVACLSKGFSSVFTVDDFLELMKYLSIIAPLPEPGTYFLPSVLPTVVLSESLRADYIKNTDPLVLTWNMEPLPRGLLPALIANLLSRKKSPLFTLVQHQTQYRNAILMSCNLGGAVLLIDAKYWLEICSSGVSYRCLDIRNAICDGIETVVQKFPIISLPQPQECFHCTYHKKMDHLCRPLEDKETLLCCEDGRSKSRISLRQKIWMTKIQPRDYFVLLDRTVDEGFVSVKWTKFTISGPPGSGRTSIMKILLNENYLMECNYTALEVGKVETTIMKIKESATQIWERIDCASLKRKIIQQKMEQERSHNSSLEEDSSAEELDLKYSGLENLKLNAYSLPMRISSPTPYNNEQMVKRDIPLYEIHLLYAVDSGGQPAFLDIAPALLRYNPVNLLTHKLNEKLGCKPKFYFSIEGKRITEPIEQQMTNLELLQASFCSLASISPPDLHQIIVKKHHDKPHFILGTFQDEIQKSGESLDVKNTILGSALDYFCQTNQVIKYRQENNQIIFPINAITKGNVEAEIAAEIREKICQSYIEADIPYRWFLFYLKLDQCQSTESTKIISMQQCLMIGDHESLKMSHIDVEASLMYYHDLTIFLYFPDILPNIVFLHPQPLFDQLFQLINISFVDKVEQLNEMNISITCNDHKQLKTRGLFKRHLLERLPNGFCKDFTAVDFLKLMSHLLIIAPLLQQDWYFFPSVLPINTSLESLKASYTRVVDPLILTWDLKPLPQHFFTSLVINLLHRRSPPLFDFLHLHEPEGEGTIEQPNELELDERVCQYRNAIKLLCFVPDGDVLLVKSKCWLHVYYNGYKESCNEIRYAIHEGIKTIVEKFQYKGISSKPQESFFCKVHYNMKDHLCHINEDRKTLTCHEVKGVHTLIDTDRQLPWLGSGLDFEDQSSYLPLWKQTPSKFDLLQLLAPLAVKWDDIGKELEIDESLVRSLHEESHLSNDIKLSIVLQRWMDIESVPVTWETIIEVVESPSFNNKRLGQEIRNYLYKNNNSVLSPRLNMEPDEDDFDRLVSDIDYKWHMIGEALYVPIGFLQRLSSSSKNDHTRLLDVYEFWRDHQPRPFTWAILIESLESPLVNDRRTAKKIQIFLSRNKGIKSRN